MTDAKSEQSQNTPSSPKTSESKPAATPPKKRHWLRNCLLGLLVLVILIVVFLPTLASTGFARGMIVSAVNDRISGKVALDDLSLSWFSPCRVSGVSVTDAQGRKVADVPQVNCDRSVWNLLWSRDNMGKVDVDIRSVDLIRAADGSTSLQDAFAPRTPEAKPAAAPAVEKPKEEKAGGPTVELNWTAARIRVAQPDGREYAVSDIKGKVQVRTLSDIVVELGATLPGADKQAKGSRLTVNAAMKNLLAGGKLDLENASGTVSVKTDPPIAMKPLVEFAADGVEGKGEINLDVSGTLSPGRSDLKYAITVKGLSAVNKDEKTPVPPLNADLSGSADYSAKTLHSTLTVGGSTSGGPLGKIESKLTYDMSGKTAVKTEQIVDALMKGQSVELPDFTLDADGGLNLAEAIKSIPGLLPLRKGAQITRGDLTIDKIHVQGGASPAANGGLTLNLTTVRGPGQPPKVWEPITVAFKVHTDSGKQLKIEQADVKASPFASVQGSGSPHQLHMAFQSDLSALRDRLDEVVDLDKTILAGNISGSLDTSRPGDDDKRIGLTLNAKAEGVVVASKPDPAVKADTSARPEPPTTYTGEVLWKANLARTDGALTLSGTMQLPRLLLSGTNDVFQGEQPVVRHDLTLYTNQAGAYDRLEVKTLAVASKLLTANLAGNLTKLDADMVLDFKGDYALSWPEATALAKRLSPEGAKTIAMMGDKKYAITIKGPLSNPQVKTTAFPSVEGKTAAGWANGSKVYGLTMGDAELTPSLGDGRVTLPVAKIAANGGSLNLGGMVDLSKAGNPRLIIKDRLAVMDNVGLNQDVGREILTLALPLLGEVAQLDGKVSLWVEGVDLPLDGQKIMVEGAGKGHLDFSGIRLRPAGAMAQLTKFMGAASDAMYDTVKFSPVDFELKNGALSYENFTLSLGGLDLKFHGSVRFDGSLNLFVSVPLKPSLLSELGIKDPTGKIAAVLDGMRIDIPVVGSRKNPTIDLTKVDAKAILDQAMKKIGSGGLPGLPDIPGLKPPHGTNGPGFPSLPPIKLPGLPK